MPILHTFAVKCPPEGDDAMSAALHGLAAGTSSASNSPVAVGRLSYYTEPYSRGYRWLCAMKMRDGEALASYGKHPAHDSGVAKMAQIMEGQKQGLINFDFEVPDSFALPTGAHILHFVFVKMQASDAARKGFVDVCRELGEKTEGGGGSWPGTLIHYGPMVDQKLSRGYNHVLILHFPDRARLDGYMKAHAPLIREKMQPHMVETPEKGGSFLAEIDVPDEKARAAIWKGLGARL
ncbi:hypothetical protein DFJ74DRAFT_674936 [Hyaloraphidium curvatum]|nr:hypothetical protein DFJ74DRAFT_674936 [Hyaloraphidium curvatum]